MRIIRLADGSEHPISMCGQSDDFLHLRVVDVSTFPEAYGLYSDPEKTRVITSGYTETAQFDTVYEGFTTLYSLQKNKDDFQIILRR